MYRKYLQEISKANNLSSALTQKLQKLKRLQQSKYLLTFALLIILAAVVGLPWVSSISVLLMAAVIVLAIIMRKMIMNSSYAVIEQAVDEKIIAIEQETLVRELRPKPKFLLSAITLVAIIVVGGYALRQINNQYITKHIHALQNNPKQTFNAFEIQLLQLRAKLGDHVAQNNLAILYVVGKGVPQNLTQAKFWLNKSAQQDDSHAKKLLKMLGQSS